MDRFDRVPDDEIATYFGMWNPPTYSLPPTYHLMVGIDPDAEEQLTSISFQDLHRPLTPGQKEEYNFFSPKSEVIKVIKLTDPRIPVLAESSMESLDIGPDDTMQYKADLGLAHKDFFVDLLFSNDSQEVDAYAQLLTELKGYPALAQHSLTIDLSPHLDPFESLPLTVEEDGQVIENKSLGRYESYGLSSLYFAASPIDYLINDNRLDVKQTSSIDGVPVYREVEQQGCSYREGGCAEDPPFYFHPDGEYTIGELQEQLAASPLGIYQLAPIQLIENEQGEDIEPTEVLSTILPGSFVPSPAHGVISIDDTEIIKGEYPIDAIRIRVGGITAYDEAAQAKIEYIAGQIAEKGFEVDVVAGASHQQMEVNVEGLGVVMQPWTTLGAAAHIVEAWSLTTLAMTMFFVIIAYLYVFNRFMFWRVNKSSELELLRQLGWTKSVIRRYFQLELGGLLLLALICSLLCLAIIQQSTELPMAAYTLNGALWASSSLAILALVGPLLNRRRPFFKPVKAYVRALSPAFAPLKSVWFYRSFLSSSFLQLGLVSTLSIFVLLTMQETVRQTDLTFLGQYINVQISGIHLLILGCAYILVLITMIEMFASLLTIRQQEVELLLTFGWKRRHILRHWLAEVSIWSLAATVVGHLCGWGLFMLLYNTGQASMSVILLSVGIFFVTILIITLVILSVLIARRISPSVSKTV